MMGGVVAGNQSLPVVDRFLSEMERLEGGKNSSDLVYLLTALKGCAAGCIGQPTNW